jgi:pimeloyl-ACP methyl ester carboxylesterase
MNTLPEFPTTPGYHDLTLDIAGHEVRLSVHVPSTDAYTQPALLALHYGGPPHGWYGRPLLEQLVVPAAEGVAGLAVAPVVLDGDWTTPASTAVVLALAHALRARSDGRCVLVGYSLGAIGCWHLLAEAPAAFDAVIPMAGRAPTSPPQVKVPVHALHSSGDELFPHAPLLETLQGLAAAGCPVSWEILPSLSHYAVGAFREPLREALGRCLAPP